MRAKIICKDHEVIPYSVNGRPRYVVDKHDHPSTMTDLQVFHAIDCVGFNWVDVSNYFDQFGNAQNWKHLNKAIDRHTIL